MDVVPLDAQGLSAATRWGGDTAEVADLLSLILPLLPLDCRARAACVCRAWRAATAHPALWEELNFQRCYASVDDATLASLCARAGATLRALHLDRDACFHVTTYGFYAAIAYGGCTGVRRTTDAQGLFRGVMLRSATA